MIIKHAHFERMRNDVSTRAPEEACGLVAGAQDRTMEVVPITNVLHSSSRYRMAPEQQVKALLTFEEREWDLLAIYHSHPNGPGTPSPTDIQEAAYPDAIYLIWHHTEDVWVCRAFRIKDSQVNEAHYEVK